MKYTINTNVGRAELNVYNTVTNVPVPCCDNYTRNKTVYRKRLNIRLQDLLCIYILFKFTTTMWWSLKNDIKVIFLMKSSKIV